MATKERPSLDSFKLSPIQRISKREELLDVLKGEKGEKGEKGDKGDPGEPGYTPHKGVDYFTPSDIEELLEMATPVKGKHYRDGKDGKDGADADEDRIVDRVLSTIPLPKDGKDGAPGKDGKSPTIASIINAIHKKKISMEAVDGLLEKFEEVYGNLRRRSGTEFTQIGGPTQFLVKAAGQEVGRFPSIDFVNATIATTGQGDYATARVSFTGGSGTTFYTETPTGAIDGSNTAYTTVNTITTVINFAIGGQYIHPSDYTISGKTITFNTALPVEVSGASFTITYA